MEPMVDLCGEMMPGYAKLLWGAYHARDRMIPTLVPLVAGGTGDSAFLYYLQPIPQVKASFLFKHIENNVQWKAIREGVHVVTEKMIFLRVRAPMVGLGARVVKQMKSVTDGLC